jgi:hypothetical protein
MHSNYRTSLARAAIALPHGPVPSNRPGVPARARRDERFGDLN